MPKKKPRSKPNVAEVANVAHAGSSTNRKRPREQSSEKRIGAKRAKMGSVRRASASTSGWNALGARWAALCRTHVGNAGDARSVRFAWAHDGRKQNGWLDLKDDGTTDTKWGSGIWEPSDNPKDTIQISFDKARHVCRLDKVVSGHWSLLEKYSLKNSRKMKNSGTKGWLLDHMAAGASARKPVAMKRNSSSTSACTSKTRKPACMKKKTAAMKRCSSTAAVHSAMKRMAARPKRLAIEGAAVATVTAIVPWRDPGADSCSPQAYSGPYTPVTRENWTRSGASKRISRRKKLLALEDASPPAGTSGRMAQRDAVHNSLTSWLESKRAVNKTVEVPKTLTSALERHRAEMAILKPAANCSRMVMCQADDVISQLEAVVKLQFGTSMRRSRAASLPSIKVQADRLVEFAGRQPREVLAMWLPRVLNLILFGPKNLKLTAVRPLVKSLTKPPLLQVTSSTLWDVAMPRCVPNAWIDTKTRKSAATWLATVLALAQEVQKSLHDSRSHGKQLCVHRMSALQTRIHGLKNWLSDKDTPTRAVKRSMQVELRKKRLISQALANQADRRTCSASLLALQDASTAPTPSRARRTLPKHPGSSHRVEVRLHEEEKEAVSRQEADSSDGETIGSSESEAEIEGFEEDEEDCHDSSLLSFIDFSEEHNTQGFIYDTLGRPMREDCMVGLSNLHLIACWRQMCDSVPMIKDR